MKAKSKKQQTKKSKLSESMRKADAGLTLLNFANQAQQQYSNTPQGQWNQMGNIPMQPMQSISPYIQRHIDTTTLAGAPQMTMLPRTAIPLDTKTLAASPQLPKDKMKMNPGMLGGATMLVDGITALMEERKQMKNADMWNQVSNVALQASRTKPEKEDRKWLRPEDDVIYNNQFNNQTGEGTNILAAKNGKKIKKAVSGADIMGFMNAGGTDTLSNYAGKAFDFNAGSQIGGAVGDSLKYIPGVGPVVGAIAEPLLTALGGALDPYARKTKKYTNQMNSNIDNMALSNGVGGVQQQYSGFMEDGGKIQSIVPERFVDDLDLQLVPINPNNIYNPILSFNRRGTTFRNEADEIDAQLTLLSQKKKLTNKEKAKLIELEDNKRLLFDYQENPQTKKFKAGGNIEDYAMGGDLQLYDGNAEMMSNNPYSPEEGQTMMLKGPSHAEGGMDISYGGNPVEAEGGEPVMKGQDGDLTIFGNMKIGKELIPLLGDEKAKNRKFKNYVADLSRDEAKYNKIKEKSILSLSDLEVATPIDKLKANSFKLNAEGNDTKLASVAEKKEKASALQTAMLDTSSELGIDPDALSRGQIKKAKMGAVIPKADDGIKIPEKEGVDDNTYRMMMGFYERAKREGKGDIVKAYKKLYNEYWPGKEEAIVRKAVPSNLAKQQGYTAEDLANPNTPAETVLGTNNDVWGIRNNQLVPIKPLKNIEGWDNSVDRLKQIVYETKQKEKEAKKTTVVNNEKEDQLTWMDAVNAALPYFRPTDAEALNPRQLTGEMYAMATNQLEPVQAQLYHPELSSPYDISMQDQLNEVTARDREANRLMGYNPAAQSILAGQSYGAKSQILADQFRTNQAIKDKTYTENRNLQNQAKLQNLQILDNQYVRQAQAKSNTKDVTQAALNSISSKFLQNQLENKTLQTYENMYNYRYGNNMRLQNWNGAAKFNIPPVGSTRTSKGSVGDIPDDWMTLYDESGNFQGTKKRTKSETESRNGSIVRAIKNL